MTEKIKKAFKLDRYDKFMLIGYSIKSATGLAGVARILEQNHPYLTIAILASGAVASEAVTYIKSKYEDGQGK